MIKHITSENFNTEVLEANTPVMVDFFANWCGPCKMMSPEIETLSEERKEIKVCKIDIDDEPELMEKYGITAIPTVLVFKNGECVRESVGYKSKEDLFNLISEKENN